MTCRKQSQAWQTQEPGPPSSLLTIIPCCVARYDPCHTCRKMSPSLKAPEQAPFGVCAHAWVTQRRKSRAKRWELGTFQEKLGWNHRSHFLADSSHYPPARNDCFAHGEPSWGRDLLPHVLTAEMLLAHPLDLSHGWVLAPGRPWGHHVLIAPFTPAASLDKPPLSALLSSASQSVLTQTRHQPLRKIPLPPLERSRPFLWTAAPLTSRQKIHGSRLFPLKIRHSWLQVQILGC